jgi:septal ring factor EnvC (AmiA/AmiB activator)
MSPTPAKAHPDPSVPKQQAAAHYATVSEQIEENKAALAEARTNIRAMRRAIEEQEDFILRKTEEQDKLKRKKRVFARARFDLEAIDQE